MATRGYLHQAAVESEEELEAGRDGRAGTLPMKLEGIWRYSVLLGIVKYSDKVFCIIGIYFTIP